MKEACSEESAKIEKVYVEMIDTVMCTKDLCPCSSEYKNQWDWINDEDFRNYGRASSLDTMSQEEIDAYEKDGVNAKVIPLYFTDEG